MKRTIIIVIAVVLLIPTAAFAVGGKFTDDDTSIFEESIEWLADAGVTLGCNPPDNDNFCPDDNVTRGQMAAFMQRFAEYLGAEDGQVNAADHALEADHASDADTLGGLSAEDLLDQSPMIVPAAAFAPDGFGTFGEFQFLWASNGWSHTSVDNGCLQAPVYVPRGAEVSSVDVVALDPAAVGYYSFSTAPLGDPSGHVETTGTPVATTDVQLVNIDLSAVPIGITNQNWIGICPEATSVVLYGAMVNYTVPDATAGSPVDISVGTPATETKPNGS